MDNSFPGTVEFTPISVAGRIYVRLTPKERVIVQIQNRPEHAAGDREAVHIGWGKRQPRISVVLPAKLLQRPGDIHMTRSTSRREVLLGAAALAGAATLPRPAAAQAKGRIVVGTWGGDYSRLLDKNIETPLLIKEAEVVQDIGGDPERRAKMLAEARLPRGTSDLQGLSALKMSEMNDAGLCCRSTTARSRMRANLLPAMKYPYGVGQSIRAR